MTPLTASSQASLSFTISWNLLKFMHIESVMLSNHLILCFPLCLLPSNFPSMRDFSSKSVLHIRRLKYWNFSFSHSNKYSLLIFFSIDWLWAPCSPTDSQVFFSITIWKHHFFGSQSTLWSNSYIRTTIGETIALTVGTSVRKVISLLFNMLSRLVMAFLPGSKSLF